MLDELAAILIVLAASAWVAVRAFRRPKGVYLRSLIGFCLSVGAAIFIWMVASPWISGEAGLGAVVIFGAVAVLSLFVAIVACAAASARYLWDFLADRDT